MPPDNNKNWGQPWTTGTVTAQNKQPGGSTTLTGMGSDSRTVWGAGKITLVAGGTTRRVLAGQDYAALDVVTMTFSPPVPSMSTPGLAAGGLLVLLAACYLLRRRL
jgi:hypothetical protein